MLHFSRPLSRAGSILASLGLVSSLAGCGESHDAFSVGEVRAAIVGGVLSEASDDGVVYVAGRGDACSGSLIAPNLVLTALHCVAQYDTNQNIACEDGEPASGIDGSIGPLVPASAIGIHTGVIASATAVAHGKKIFSTGSSNICRHDMALVLLDKDIDLPLRSVRLDRRTHPGERARVMGYGYTENDPSLTEPGRHVRENVQITAAGADQTNPAEGFNVSPYTLVVGEGPCQGDSGGPLLSQETDAVLGVYSLLLGPQCRAGGVKSAYTQIAGFKSIILDALEEAGHEPLLEEVAAAGSGGLGGSAGLGGSGGTPGQAGEAGATGEGGAATGGTAAVGGTGGNSATGGTGGSTGGTASGGDGGTGAKGEGSGSRRDPACTCRTAGDDRSPRSLVGLALAALLLVLRRRVR